MEPLTSSGWTSRGRKVDRVKTKYWFCLSCYVAIELPLEPMESLLHCPFGCGQLSPRMRAAAVDVASGSGGACGGSPAAAEGVKEEEADGRPESEAGKVAAGFRMPRWEEWSCGSCAPWETCHACQEREREAISAAARALALDMEKLDR